MTKIYSKNTWQDEILGGPERYNIADNNGNNLNANVQIGLNTSVTTPGTVADASHMNNIENGIDGLDTKVAGMEVHPATSKTTPADNDEMGWLDSANSFSQAKMTYLNFRTALAALWSWATNTHNATVKTTPADADEFSEADSAASFGLKKITWLSIRTALAALFASLTQPIKETSGPTLLTTGAIADGQFLKRVGATLVGALPIVGNTVFIFNGTSTYTPSAGVRALLVECIGGGGAGGGAATSSSNCSLGGGGGSGAYSSVLLTGAQIKGSFQVAVGAGGTPGAAGAAGGNGGDTTFDSPSVCTAKGGTGGGVLAAGTSLVTQAGGAGGLASSGVGTILSPGANGGWGVRLSASTGHAGDGGDAPVGGGTSQGASATVTPGATGSVYGGGGSGAFTATTAQAGGAGANGLIRVTEMF